jgi:hypothetical protein
VAHENEPAKGPAERPRGDDGLVARSLVRRRLVGERLAWLAALACAVSCAYTAGTGLPEHVRTVRVEVFENRTGYPGLEAELAVALVREFQADGALEVASMFADSVLTGSLLVVRRGVLQEDGLDDVVTGQVTVEAAVTLEDAATGRMLLKDEVVTSREVRDASGVYRLRRGEAEAEGRQRALRALARNIVRRIVEAW